jgi:gamma-glutamylputrescine oxidase
VKEGSTPFPATRAASRPRVRQDLRFDAVVVGAGMAGLEAARLLASSGLRTAVLERESVGFGASGRNLGLALVGLGEPFSSTSQRLGLDAALTIWRTHRENQDALTKVGGRLVRRTGYMAVARTESELAILDEGAGVLRDRGFDAERIPRAEIEVQGLASIEGGVRFADGAVVEPMGFVRHLARAAESAGARIFEKSPVARLERAEGGVSAITPEGVVAAEVAVVATNVAAGDLLPKMRQRIVPFRAHGFATAVARRLPEIEPGFVGRGDFYWRHFDGRLLVGGDDPQPVARTRNAESTERRVRKGVEQQLRRYLPHWGRLRLAMAWSGSIDVSVDGLPYVGLLNAGEPIAVAAGFTGLGFSYALIAARWAADIVQGKRDPTPPIFRASRTPTVDRGMPWQVDDLRAKSRSP